MNSNPVYIKKLLNTAVEMFDENKDEEDRQLLWVINMSISMIDKYQMPKLQRRIK